MTDHGLKSVRQDATHSRLDAGAPHVENGGVEESLTAATIYQLAPSMVTTQAGVVVVRDTALPVRVKDTVERSGAGDAGVTWPQMTTGGSGMAARAGKRPIVSPGGRQKARGLNGLMQFMDVVG